MNPLKELLRQVAGLCPPGSWALVEGLAVSARVEPRFTRDLDMAVTVETDAEAEALLYLFRKEGFRLLALVEQEAADRLATARLSAPRESGVILDLLFASSGRSPDRVAPPPQPEKRMGIAAVSGPLSRSFTWIGRPSGGSFHLTFK